MYIYIYIVYGELSTHDMECRTNCVFSIVVARTQFACTIAASRLLDALTRPPGNTPTPPLGWGYVHELQEPSPTTNIAESLSQAISVGIILVGRLAVKVCLVIL